MAYKRFRLMLVALLFSLFGIGASLAAEVQYIQIRDAVVREKASSLGKALGSIPYTTPVTVLQKSGGWTKVSCNEPKLSGWISSSALTVKNLALKAGAGGSSAASDNETALAGKGFNEEVEKEYRNQNPKVSFEWVDKMEAITVADEDLKQFLAAGPQGANK